MLDPSAFENILPEEQLARKLNAFQGVKARNNRLVLGYLASQGPSLPYRIFKDLKNLGYYKDNQYPTIHRRVKSLVDEGYVTAAGTRSTARGKQSEEIRYGLTPLGFIASLALENIRRDPRRALEHHMNTIIPTKIKISSVDVEAQRLAQGILAFLGKTYTSEEIYATITALLLGYLATSAPPLDELITASMEEYVPWFKPIIANAVMERKKLPQGSEKIVDLFLLLDDPAIFDLVMIVLPVICAYLGNQIRTYSYWLIGANGLYEVFEDISPEVKPSKRAEDFVANDLKGLFQELEQSLREYEGDSQ